MGTPLRILANRGANGIDGILSSALGATFEADNRYLLVGDLAFLHDINGLLMARTVPITILLVNNTGGGIFSFLPQQNLDPALFEPLFGTAQDVDFSHLAAGYGVEYERISSIAHLQSTLQQQATATRVLEIVTDRPENVRLHRLIWEQTNEALQETLR